MRPGECGFAYPPADGTVDREIVDRFAHFLRLCDDTFDKKGKQLGDPISRWERYLLRIAIARMESFNG